MNKEDIVKAVAGKTGCTQVNVEKIINSTLEAISEGVRENNRIVFKNFGVFSLRKIAPRTLLHPATGKEVFSNPKYSVRFKAAVNIFRRRE